MPGDYVDTSTVTGWKNYDHLPYANNIDPVSASTTLTIVQGQVLGASTSTVPSCAPLLSSYIRRGHQNDSSEVTKLQQFLDDNENAGLALTGVYDAATIAAVEHFQLTHKGDILSPWGITSPTGNVYYTTQREINVLHCGTEDTFTLRPLQLKEIAAYSGRMFAASIPAKSTIAHAENTSTSSTQVTYQADLPLPQISAHSTDLQNSTSSFFEAVSTFISLPQTLSHFIVSWGGDVMPTAFAEEK